ncbi:hypothetical protein ABN254_21720, partial [Providencia rettgeri]
MEDYLLKRIYPQATINPKLILATITSLSSINPKPTTRRRKKFIKVANKGEEMLENVGSYHDLS